MNTNCDSSHAQNDRECISLCETLDRVLHKGAVVLGEVTISVADVDLIYLGLQVVLTSIETARRVHGDARPAVCASSREESP